MVRVLKGCISSLTIFVFLDWLYFTFYPKWKIRGVARKFSEGDRNILKYVSLTNYQGGGESSSDLFFESWDVLPCFSGESAHMMGTYGLISHLKCSFRST